MLSVDGELMSAKAMVILDLQLNIFTSEIAQRCRRTHFQAQREVKG